MSAETYNTIQTMTATKDCQQQEIDELADTMYWASMEVGNYSGRTPGAESAMGAILIDRCTGPDNDDGSFHTKPDGSFFEPQIAQAAWEQALQRRHGGGRPQPIHRTLYSVTEASQQL